MPLCTELGLQAARKSQAASPRSSLCLMHAALGLVVLADVLSSLFDWLFHFLKLPLCQALWSRLSGLVVLSTFLRPFDRFVVCSLSSSLGALELFLFLNCSGLLRLVAPLSHSLLLFIFSCPSRAACSCFRLGQIPFDWFAPRSKSFLFVKFTAPFGALCFFSSLL